MFDGLQEQLVAFQNVYHSVAEESRKKEDEKNAKRDGKSGGGGGARSRVI